MPHATRAAPTGAVIDNRTHPRRSEGRAAPRREMRAQAETDARPVDPCAGADRAKQDTYSGREDYGCKAAPPFTVLCCMRRPSAMVVALRWQKDFRNVQTLSFCYICGVQFENDDETDGDHVPPKNAF